MKKLLTPLLALALAIVFAACQAAEPSSSVPSSLAPSESSQLSSAVEEGAASSSQLAEPSEAPAGSSALEGSSETGENGGVLIAYFSWAENAVLEEGVDAMTSPSVSDPGNVQQLAGWIQEETGGELFSIQVTDPYPSDWDACLERANEERGQNARPALVEPQVENLDSYDTVFLGYPNWWYGVPMALLTFLEENDLSGKDVYLFCSHGTGGMARSVEIITEAAPEANISDNIFDCYEEDAPASQGDIQAWVAELGLSQPQETTSSETEENDMESTQVAVTCGDLQVVYALNDSPAAQGLLSQLPLTVEVEDFSTNEKVFYPPQELDASDTPLAEGGAGTLAYYAPWGDVVLFYDSFSANSSLFELGEAVSGAENIGQMSGTITVETVE
ncbi:putative flavodoxin [Firmicutes bacterium CAG:94]|nr:putative flavodoxin [Firmicutes bacterium CAG:94]